MEAKLTDRRLGFNMLYDKRQSTKNNKSSRTSERNISIYVNTYTTLVTDADRANKEVVVGGGFWLRGNSFSSR